MNTLTHALHAYLSLCTSLLHEGGVMATFFGLAFLCMPVTLVVLVCAQIVEWRMQDARALERDERYRAIRMGWDNPCTKHQTIGCKRTRACAIRANARLRDLTERDIWNLADETRPARVGKNPFA